MSVQWQKAGRPRTKVQQKQEHVDITWTKEELTTYTKGLYAIAMAVLKQWHLDGEPEEIDSFWFDIINLYKETNKR